ncbi:ATP-binding protein [Labrys wisconsinensis]|uniref:histidine kinase n=1 Tax=Labrys wisconsinensis TaxID=425677 RepID=A0ABU0J644_9HYPH|nr:ATP-binding protein [Labrys wisconsinensis]MDQ0469728.1 signal transduction histidine kinase [Labrys wisconsinensis]
MTTRSLAFRLFASAAAWVVAVLLIAGLLLVSYYQHATEKAFDERLHVYLKTLVADLARRDVGDRTAPGALGEPRFELPLSGWYWQISRIDKAENGGERGDSNGSKSLFEASLPSLEELGVPAEEGGVREAYINGPDGRRLRAVERLIDLGEDGRYRITVAGPADEIDAEIADFQRALLMTFAFLGVGLVGSTLLQVRFGLLPLKRMSQTLAAMRAGRAEKLPPDLPDEIAPLARELDALVDSNRQVVERARTHVGNLAHALKTPLSVIANEAEAASPAGMPGKMLQQVAVMREQIDHHLQRARIAAAVSVVGTVTEVAPVVDGLVRAMEKIHRDKGLTIHVAMAEGLRFRGERQDLEEMVGNLVDNACKWAASRVEIAARAADQAGAAVAILVIDDDGPGLPAEKRDEVAHRGRRLDETKPGAGLGLAIVTDLVLLYRGRFRLEAAPSGGVRAVLELPAVSR